MKNALPIWIWSCAFLNCVGWFLSAIHQLNTAGYAVTVAVGVVAFFIAEKFWPSTISLSRPNFKKSLRRFQRPFPFAFLVLSIMAFIGGAIHPPANYDGLAYRLPRVLHWLAASQWHWIHTIFPRVNASSCGIEWISAPLMAFFKTDRLLFLINIISFLFLPGLIFGILTRLGIQRRAAWHWMWIAPTGYCFLLQAASIGNDLFGAVFALAAVDYALRSKISKNSRDFFCSILAAALMTADKFSNIPLLLPWAIAIFPSLKIFSQRPIATAAVCVIAAIASFLPKAFINQELCHDWSGVSLEYDQPHGSLPLRTSINIVLVTLVNLTPPVFPAADQWDSFVQKVIPAGLNARMHDAMTEREAAEFRLDQMQIEESAGLGLGVTALLLASALAAAIRNLKLFLPIQFHSQENLWRAGIIFTPWISLLALLARSEVYPISRIAASYYLLLLPSFLASPAHAQLVKKTWWRFAAFIVFAMAAGLLVILPARPLFPALTIFQKIYAHHPNSKLLTRITEVYTVYHNRAEAFAPVLDILPPGLKVLGFITYDDPETSLWFPMGSRTIFHVRPDDDPAYLKDHGVEYILANSDKFHKQFPGLDEWLKKMNASVVQKIQLNLRAADGPIDWYLIKLN